MKFLVLLAAVLFPLSLLAQSPTITSFTPTSAASGTTITITGDFFSGATDVSFGGTAAASFIVDSPTQISAVVANGTSGSVSVTTPDGTDLLAGFTFIPAPNITSFAPTSAASGATVIITGTNFTGATAVSFGGTAAASFIVDSPTQISAVVASGTSGNVSVTTPGGNDLLAGFTFIPAPNITSFAPTSAASGATVIITGTNFTGATAVSFGGTAAASFIVDSPTQISAVVASGTSGNVSVTTPGGNDLLAGFTFIPAPNITSFAPTSAASGATVTITGTDFSGATAVSFGGTAAASFIVNSSTQISAVVASGSSGNVSVTTPGGNDLLAGFTFILAPNITSFAPTSAASGATVIITGTNFTGATVVSFGGTAAASFIVDSPTQISAVVASGSSGNVSVTTPGGNDLLAGFTFIPAPNITSFAPTSAASGATVTITGTDFSGATAVSFGGTAAASFIVNSSTQISAVVASGSSGNVSVTTPGGNDLLAGFTFIPAPNITSFAPTSAASGATVIITGTNFTGATAVSFGGTAAASFIVNSSTQISAVVASGSSGNVSVTTPGGNDLLAGFTFIPAPNITSFAPTSAASGATVIITGTNFTGATAVSFGGTAAASFIVNSSTQISAVVASGSSGNVSVTTPGGNDLLAGFTFIPAPNITSFAPTSAASGATVIITGTNFTGATVVSFGGTAAASFIVDSPTQISAVVASGSSGNVSVTTPGGNDLLAGFTFIPAPNITSFAPTSAASGATVIITGTNFTGATAVSFGGTAAASFIVDSPTQISAVVASGSSGNVSVTTPGGNDLLAGFTFIPAPNITSFAPTSAASGATVIITGTNFTGATVVSFGGTAATSFIVNSSTQISAVVASGTSGNVSVTTPGGNNLLTGFTFIPAPNITSFAPTSAASGATVIITGANFTGATAVSFGGTSAASFIVNSPTQISAVVASGSSGNVSVTTPGGNNLLAGFTFIPAPNITSFAPTSAASGATVIITGTNFTGATAVSFGGTAAASFIVNTPTQISAVVASGSSGNVSVTTPGGNDLLAGFTYLPTPAISSFTPTSGAVGATVTISGSNFSATPGNNTVRFNGTAAVVSAASTTSITTTVPAGATTGKISVTVSGVTGTSVDDFTVLPTPVISGYSPTGGAVGATIIINGSDFSLTPGDNIVTFFNGHVAAVTASTSTTITTTVPSGAATGTVSLTLNGITVTGPSFTVLPTPTITSLNPSSGAVGASIQINGTNFSTTLSDNVVAFNGTVAIVTASLPNNKRLTVTVPAGATTGLVTLTLNGVTVSSPSNFTVLPTPTITSFSPTSGAPGATVVISGTNFNLAPSVAFNGINASVSSSTSTSITAVVPSGAGSGTISVTTSGVTITSADSFTVLATPSITSFTPDAGAEGTTVTISGTNFSTNPVENIISFNGTLANVTASTTTSITTTVPSGATTGLISLTLGGVTVSSPTNFTVLPKPTITGFNPASGAESATVIISGTNFSASPTVSFNGTLASVTASSSTSITTTVPVNAVTGPISVTTSGITITSVSNFNVLPSPAISSFSPTSGAVGATVTITGDNFNTTPGNNIVKFNTTTAVVTSATSNSLTTTVPVGASSGKVSVTVSGVTVISTNDFTVLPTPSISGFNPTNGAVGALITISGNNFSTTPSDNVIKFNGVTAIVTSSTSSSITTSVPMGAGTGLISLTVSGITVFSGSNFTVLPTPTISGFSPSSGAVGAAVTISGTNFSASPVVTFNGTNATVTASSATSIVTSVPTGASSGAIFVTTSGVTVNSSSSFTVLPTPSISGFSPGSGAVGATVVISGSNFSSTPSDHVVKFNTTTAIVTAASPSSLTVTVPPGATSGKISVTVSGVTVLSAGNFIVLSNPTITGFSPSSGAVGAIVTITGTNFNTTPAVSFNGTAASLTSFTTSSITTIVPTGATTGAISITVNGVTITSGSIFTVLPTPTITGFSPISGAISASVNISGTNFITTPVVSFNGTTATVTTVTTTSIATTVPSGANSGPISITVNGITISSGSNFTVLPTPSISGFTPTSGAEGATITINGNNFSPSPLVSFNGVSATVVTSTGSSITAVVPSGTSTGKISVTTRGVTVLSSSNFTVLPTPTITSFNPTSGAVGATVMISGTNFGGSPVVQFNGVTAVVSASSATSITTSVPMGAGSGSISITTSGITISSSSNFTVLPTPTITGFNPSSGAVSATVIITGTNFSSTPANNIVKFNNTTAVVIASTPSSITTTVPASATSGKISVTTSGVTILSSGNFTVLPSPTITSFNPTAAGVGTTVTITGTNFISSPAVEFNGTPAIVTSFNSTSITTSVPSGAGSGPITVSLSGVTVSSSSNFTVFGTPSITSFSPNNGAYGVTVTISGSNFSSTPANNTVDFNGVSATVTASTTSSITTKVPVGATTGPISVTVNGITGTSSSNFTVPTPTITSFTPVSGAVGASITLTGTNFSATPANNDVEFNGVNATVTSSTTTSITATVPVGATTGKITVTVAGVPGISAANFTVLPTPTITSFAPASGAVSAVVIINGTNFSTNATDNVVKFNNTTAIVSSSTANSITTTVPAGATTGKISVTVSGVTINSAANFNVLATPTITGFSPASGAVGASVTITGTNFSTTPGNNDVEFNGVAAVVTASTTTSVTATVPPGASTGKISLTVSGVTINSASNFTVLPSPTLMGFTPASGAAGTLVTINGTNFSATPANNVVLFNGIASVVTSSTTNSIATSVPVGASTGPISVIVSGITLTSGTNFNVLPTPTITNLNPASGAETATVIITGSNFSTTPANNIITFNGVTGVVSASTSTSITTTVPDAATTGKISLTLNGITIYSTNNFTVLPSPTLTGFSPSTGAPGAIVTISGTNFSTTPANNSVIFNGTPAIVTASTSTSITTSVPVGASTGPIAITVSGITLTSASNFNVLSSPSLTEFTPGSGAIGATVTLKGSNFGSTPAENVIKFNGITALTLSASTTSLTTKVPSGATTGKISLTTSGVTLNSATNFIILPTPTITGFSPASASEGAIVTITGTNFNTPLADNQVSFNGIVADITSSTSTSISAIVPAGAITGPISIIVNGVALTTANNFTVLPKATIIDFTPHSGAVSASVTITGTNFNTTAVNNVVQFNGVNAIVTNATATSITTSVPNGATTGPITVTVNGVTIMSAIDFTVLPPPILSGFDPGSGAVGAVVTISGENFSATPSENVVKFNDVTANITDASSTSITTKVPLGASTGKISVTTSGVTVYSATNFTVMPSPSITNFNPQSSVTGWIVNITGLNFDSDESKIKVTFNGIDALVIASSPTIITTTVPDDATSGPISVTINGVTVFSASNFVVIIVDNSPPLLDINSTPSEVILNSSLLVSAKFSDPDSEVASASVTFQSVTNRGVAYTLSLDKNGETWEKAIPWDLIRELGVEYKLNATNSKGLTYTSDYFPVRVLFPGNGLTIPYSSFGGDISNYRIISFPMDLNNPSVQSVFDELPPYDRTKWRISHYENATNSNKELTPSSNIEAGKGYWLLIKDIVATPLTTGTGKSVNVSQQPFTVPLKAGWNQIGNPYYFNLLWSDLVAANPGLPVNLRSYNGAIKNFENKTILSAMEGGFVNVANDMTLIYPVKKNLTGRIESPQSTLKNPIDQNEWDVDFTVKQGDITNVIGGIGMRLDASEDFDIYDGFSMPRFSEYLDVNHEKKLNQYNYSKDVIPTIENHTWHFKVEASAADKLTSISWDNSYLGSNELNLILFDENTNVWVDMKQFNSYSFTPPTNFKVVFGSENHVKKEIGLGNARILEVSPNPAKGPINIHLFLPEWQRKFPVQLELKSLTGITLANIFSGELESGYQQFEWSGESNSNPLPSGVYLIQMRCDNTIQTVRVVLLN